MAFSVNALTTAGNALLAQATSSNPIVYIGAVASINDYTALDLASMDDPTDAAWTVKNGVIVAASATDITARIIAGFYNQSTAKTVKTVGIVGRLASESDADAIVVAAVSDSTASIRIPDTTEASVRVEIAINIAISDALSVTVTSSTAGSAMLSDLDRLVSCHKPGQPTTGENQYIYGAKHFEGLVYAWGLQSASMEFDTDDGNITWTAADNTEIEYLNNGTYNESLRINADTAVIINAGSLVVTGDFNMMGGKVLSDLIPDGSVNIGASGYEWNEIHANSGHFSSIETINYSGGTFSGNVELDSGLYVHGRISMYGGYDLDDSAPLTVAKCPLACTSGGISIGGIILAIVTSTTTGVCDSGLLIPSTMNIYKAESVSAAGGSALAPKFTAGAPLSNDGSSYMALTAFSISGVGHQALVLILRVK